MSSLPPVTPYSEKQLAELYPKELKLTYLQVIFRHGERTPVRARLKNVVPEHWPLCQTAERFRSIVRLSRNHSDSVEYSRLVESAGINGDPVSLDQKGICLLGELTDRGRESTLALGERLRNLYVNRLAYLPEDITSDSQVYLRTTNMSRTWETLQHVFAGLYPPAHRSSLFKPKAHTRNVTEENLYPNEHHCKRLAALAYQFSQKAATKWDPILKEKVTPKLRHLLSNGITVNGSPRVSGVLDTINAALGNGIPLPSALFDPEVYQILEKSAVSEWFDGYEQSNEYRRLGVGRFLGDIYTRMTDKNNTTKVALYASHDTTIAAILASLDCFDGAWPFYTSHIAIETFTSAKSSNSWFSKPQKYVRLRYNDKALKLPACAETVNHYEGDESLCTMKAFGDAVKKMIPNNWQEECNFEMDRLAELE
ncbi:putative acid phosphatase [Neolecta irregularis DAH-3]|uniref:Putative acid phosphatase n=1 Tax=Neolecta irregularis (strain DAH-3) TaxID=1198029 RepID=A0A1U7LU49_NEOID|nr:putative acid phosphatase [Neolecta irregularis DAH-3]|eukprot:OLL26103.1 putative acid phosphatase [Neolecta irregularis DAH-3]